MRNRLILVLTLTGLALLASFSFVQATPGAGVTSTLFAVGRFDGIDATTLTDTDPSGATDFWQARIKVKGSTDVHVLENRIVPGGTFGWHSHPGPSLVVIKSGTLTLYFGNDPTCTPHVYGPGSGFVDNGGDVHVVRNEGSVETVVYVTSIVPEGFTRRIDEPAPAACGF